MMEKIQFKCKLLSDVVLNQTSATEGKIRCLDFIPGNNFLGIVASQLYKEATEQTYALFHSGKVRFGDAHPSIDGIRGVHVPACMFKPKLKERQAICYIHHLIKSPHDEHIRAMQLKQCRCGYYIFQNEQGKEVEVYKNFAIKSAYDADTRRSKDEAMFGYESMRQGVVLYFDVEIDDDMADMKEAIVNALCGTKHIGRSRTAQYGLVEIEQACFEDTASGKEVVKVGAQEEEAVAVYADGRLIFVDDDGVPTLDLKAKDLGFEEDGAEIDWALSQVRTFQYAPWNYERQAFDADRCGFEKGSVFVVKCKQVPGESRYIGSYRQEGFGKIVYNPAFLDASGSNEDGKALYQLTKADDTAETDRAGFEPVSTPLTEFLRSQKERQNNGNKCLKIVNDFVKYNEEIFKQDLFASQWGSIRSLAMLYSDGEVLRKNIDSYLDHGVAKEKWEQRGRKSKLDRLMDDVETDMLQEVMINLASEMAKKCRSKKEK